MTPATLHQELADALDGAERTRTAIAPPTEANPGLTLEDAYVIQTSNGGSVPAGSSGAGKSG